MNTTTTADPPRPRPRLIGWDTETVLIRERGKAKTNLVPALVCLSWDDGTDTGLLDARDAIGWFEAAIIDESIQLVAHNAKFDLLVMLRAVWEATGRDLTSAAFDAVRAGRIRDSALIAKLSDLSIGDLFPTYALAAVVKRMFCADISASKKQTWAWRLRYDELLDVPIEAWPPRARSYALEDATWARRIAAQHGVVQNERFQTAADLGLGMFSARGLCIDADWAGDLDAFYASESEEADARLRSLGLKNSETGSKVRAEIEALFERAFASIGEEPWRTTKGATSCARDALNYLEERGATVEGGAFDALISYSRAEKFRATYLAPILAASDHGEPLCVSYNVLVSTGRTSAVVQQYPARAREDERSKRVQGPMIRGCFVPSPGCVIIGCDYTAIELVTLSQVCLNLGWSSDMAEAINSGRNLHTDLAAQLLGISYEDAVDRVEAGEPYAKQMRQVCKIANFSYPAGAAAATFTRMAKLQGTVVDDKLAADVRAAWFARWREMGAYHGWIAGLEVHRGRFVVEQHGPGGMITGWRRRVTDRFTSAANSPFQGLASDLGKLACYEVAKACHSPEHRDPRLIGAAPLLFVHDEIVIEAPIENAEVAAAALEEIMLRCARVFVPDVLVTASADILYERWAK